MDLQTRKIEFIQEFLKIQSEEVISRLEKLLNQEQEVAETEHLQPMSMQELHERIEKSLDDSKKGNVISAEDLKTEIEKWS